MRHAFLRTFLRSRPARRGPGLVRDGHSHPQNGCCRQALYALSARFFRSDSILLPRWSRARKPAARIWPGTGTSWGEECESSKPWGWPAACCVGVLAPAVARAQEACTPGPNALGVSRVVEIDTSAGPRFGVQYKEHDLLADGEVVLTFDDGPLRAYTKPVLEALQAHCTKATFFVVGRMAVADPEMVREYARLGHTVGIHTWSHANLHGADAAQGARRDRARLQRRAAGAGQAGGAVLPLSLPGRLQVHDDASAGAAHRHLLHRRRQQGLPHPQPARACTTR